MPYSNHPVAQATTKVPRVVPQATLAMGSVGAVIGGTAAAAKNIQRVRDAEINREEAVKDTIKEAAGAGLATATATAVVGSVGATGVIGLLGIVAVATGTKYLWNAATTTPAAVSKSKRKKSKKEKKSKSEA